MQIAQNRMLNQIKTKMFMKHDFVYWENSLEFINESYMSNVYMAYINIFFDFFVYWENSLEFINESYMSNVYMAYINIFFDLKGKIDNEIKDCGKVMNTNLVHKKNVVKKHILRLEKMYYCYLCTTKI